MHKKYAKITTAALFGILVAGSASGCGENYDLTMWIGFGSSYTTAVNNLIDRYTAQAEVSIKIETQGGYDKLQSNLTNSISTSSYPNFAHGYPDHFAGYIKSNIQVELDDYIDAYNKENKTDLLSDYYPEYLKEVKELKYRSDGTGYIMGLPFNKSTEVLAYNKFFVDYAMSKDSSITFPETWDEWKTVGPKFLAVMDGLYESYLYGVPSTSDDTKYSNYVVSKSSEAPTENHVLLLDCSLVKEDGFRLMSWDSSDNMFITIVRQWGSVYTTYTSDDAKKYKHGWAEFNTAENKDKTMAAMEFFSDLYKERIFGLPGNISDDSYSSTAFKTNKCMFVVCSSGGLSYNVVDKGRMGLAPIPYKTADKKYVISQGTNLCLFAQGEDEDMQKAFNAMVAISTGELQGSWAAETGYYPASKSATESSAYQALMTTEFDNPTKIAYQESAKLNESIYMDSELGWNKFVDPGFVGSSEIRKEVETIMGIVFAQLNSANPKDNATILDESIARLKTYNPDIGRK